MTDTITDKVHVLGIAGSLRAGSYNKLALRAAQELAPAGMQIESFDIDGLPGFNEDLDRHPPAQVAELKQRVRAADAVLFATPEYNYSIPGVLKNAIDWASRPYGDSAWHGKPAAILSASIGSLGGARAQYHLRQSLVFLNMPCVLQPEVMIANASAQFDPAGSLTNETARRLIGQLLEALARLVRSTRAAG